MMGALTVVIGPPCAGKSTYVRENAAPGDVVVDFDALAVTLGADESHAVSKDVATVAFAARAAVITEVMKGIETDAWIIHTSPSKARLAEYAAAGATMVLLDPGIKECLARAEADGRPETTAAVIEKWYASPPEIPGPPKSGGPHRALGGVMKIKTASVKIKAAGSADGLLDGQFTAYASVFGNEDSFGDTVVKGAFTDTLAEWAASGDSIPVLWGHDSFDPFSNIGSAVTAVEDDHGLLVTGQLDLEAPKAAQVYRLLKGRRVTQMSFAYDVIDGGPVTTDGNTTFELRKLKLYEVSVVPLGANQETEVLAVKAAVDALAADGLKVGRVLAQKHIDSLRSAQEAIGAVITAAEADQGKASATGPAKDEEPSGAKSEEPTRDATADDLETHIRIKILEGATP